MNAQGVVNKECWKSLHAMNGSGYPTRTVGYKMHTLHKMIWEETKGKVEAGMELHHLCGQKNCYNPNHLMKMSVLAHRLIHNNLIRQGASKTHCLNGHEFNYQNTYFKSSRPNNRECRVCHRNRMRKSRSVLRG